MHPARRLGPILTWKGFLKALAKFPPLLADAWISHWEFSDEGVSKRDRRRKKKKVR